MAFSVKDILNIEVSPALGCTEPGAIALGAAAARSVLPNRKIDSIQVGVDPNIYKNGLAAAIPGAPGLTGIDMAAAIGAFGGDPRLKLQVLDSVDHSSVDAACRFIEDGRVTVSILDKTGGIFVRTVIRSGSDTAESVIEGTHDNLICLKLNNETVSDSPLLVEQIRAVKSRLADLEGWLRQLSLADLLRFLDDLDTADMAYLKEGVRLNMALAQHGLEHGSGLGVGRMLERLTEKRLIAKDMISHARTITAAAADARMAGVKMAAMSSAGSGNHGITAVLPIWAVKTFTDTDETTALKALGLSHIITGYIKAHTGRLSAVCGCSIAAGAGASAGVAYLLGGNLAQISGAVINIIEDLAGVICDGAKAGCALKLATAAGSAVQAALFSLNGINVQSTDGIIGASFEQTTRYLGTLSTEGMIEADRTILGIMIKKKFAGNGQ